MRTLQAILPAALAGLALAGLVGCSRSADPQADAAARFNTCVPCHGSAGQGNAELQAPPLAGMPAWYLREQLNKFRAGWRGTHPDDLSGMRMRPLSLTLPSDAHVNAMAEYVASLPAQVHPPTLQGADAAKGQTWFAPCVACHGVDGSGNRVLNAPSIAGHADWYVHAQLQKFKSGHRGAHPKDVIGAQMRAMSLTLPDDQAMKDVAAYVNSLARK